MDKLKIRETIYSNHFYHLSINGKSICGDKTITMETEIPTGTWGLKTHLNEKYCEKCDKIFKEMNIFVHKNNILFLSEKRK